MSKIEILDLFDKNFKTDVSKHIQLDMKLLDYIYDNIDDDIYRCNEDYKKILHKEVEISDKLLNTFSNKQKELFNRYCRLNNELAALDNKQHFLYGYIISSELNRESSIKR